MQQVEHQENGSHEPSKDRAVAADDNVLTKGTERPTDSSKTMQPKSAATAAAATTTTSAAAAAAKSKPAAATSGQSAITTTKSGVNASSPHLKAAVGDPAHDDPKIGKPAAKTATNAIAIAKDAASAPAVAKPEDKSKELPPKPRYPFNTSLHTLYFEGRQRC